MGVVLSYCGDGFAPIRQFDARIISQILAEERQDELECLRDKRREVVQVEVACLGDDVHLLVVVRYGVEHILGRRFRPGVFAGDDAIGLGHVLHDVRHVVLDELQLAPRHHLIRPARMRAAGAVIFAVNGKNGKQENGGTHCHLSDLTTILQYPPF